MTRAPEERATWIQQVNSLLRRDGDSGIQVLDLFCGAGGLSLGFWARGFDVVGIDWNADAIETYGRNLGRATCAELGDETALPPADVVIAGPPCQPWSRAGKGLREQDERDGLAVVARAIREIQPTIALVENVPDLARPQSRHHLDAFKEAISGLGYAVGEHVLNAADFGVPQNRRRVFISAALGDQPLEMPEPWPTKITVRQAIRGTFWRVSDSDRLLSDGMNDYIARYERASGCRTPRDLHLDQPARTLTVRNLAGATGDMIRLRLADGRRRMLTAKEAARLQSFPDSFQFHGSSRSRFEQIGNAVPPLLSLAIAGKVRERIAPAGNNRALARRGYPVPSSPSASATMRANRRRDTRPERRLRSALHRRGWRFRVDLPVETAERRVRPDIAFTRRRLAVFVDGCFWHRCPDHGRRPRANASYWEPKLRRNVERDRADTESLEACGWTVVRIWEHEDLQSAVAAVETALTMSTTMARTP